MRLIDADKLKKCYEGHNGIDDKADYSSIRKMIDNQTTAYDVDKVVEGLKTDSSVKLYGSRNSGNYMIPVNRAIEIVKQSGVSDDVCEYRITNKVVYASCNNKQIASAFCWFNECDDYKYCPYCGKRIKVAKCSEKNTLRRTQTL